MEVPGYLRTYPETFAFGMGAYETSSACTTGFC